MRLTYSAKGYVSNHWKEKVSGNGYIHAAELDWSKLPQ